MYNDECFDKYLPVENPGCKTEIKELLDDKKKKLLLFAPSNRGFERAFRLPEGGFDGMGAEAIKLALPALLARLELTGFGEAETAI